MCLSGCFDYMLFWVYAQCQEPHCCIIHNSTVHTVKFDYTDSKIFSVIK